MRGSRRRQPRGPEEDESCSPAYGPGGRGAPLPRGDGPQPDHPGAKGHHRPEAADRGGERAQPVLQDYQFCPQFTSDHSL